ncbi:hypothetical protein DF021_06215 [Burkholderia stagnalis]|uniref:Uncharacterized protein n=1 Tax=Burkholderia stagnalis TaxID=1503054 RepID=A0ABX9YTP6_9BURK|nr:hypothetical protein DF158_06215 [Burkholderia stagnalis]RQR03787.1 hypothetical protein DF025_31620 [Burkholderia stagnalis]RQR12582.1 hypothetical protein DF026_32495 [Burkholderia stagnalis]RQR15274.1 hypothetical protein DF021_06215 [Burkholderia stagnalis]RQY96465.1 hypothetical protein DF017_07395 [Burkholderia stagnalis]
MTLQLQQGLQLVVRLVPIYEDVATPLFAFDRANSVISSEFVPRMYVNRDQCSVVRFGICDKFRTRRPKRLTVTVQRELLVFTDQYHVARNGIWIERHDSLLSNDEVILA